MPAAIGGVVSAWPPPRCRAEPQGHRLAPGEGPGTPGLRGGWSKTPPRFGAGPGELSGWARPTRGTVRRCPPEHHAPPWQQPPPARSVRRQPRCAALLLVPAPGACPHARDAVGAPFPRPPHRAALRLLRAGGEVPGPAAPSCGQIKADAWGSWGAGTGRCRDFFPSFFSPC